MNIDKIKYLLKDKIHQMFICLMISLMLLSNFPAYIINAEDGDGTNVSNSPAVLTLSKDVKSPDGDKYTFTVTVKSKHFFLLVFSQFSVNPSQFYKLPIRYFQFVIFPIRKIINSKIKTLKISKLEKLLIFNFCIQ